MTETSPTPSEAPTLEGAAETTLLTETPTTEPPPAEEAPKEEKAEPTAFSFDTIEVPEGLTLSDDQKAAVSEIAAKHGLTNEAMQDLLPLVRDSLKEASESSTRLWEQTNEAWIKEIKADPEIGGDKLNENLASVARLIDQSPDPAGLRQALNFTGAGNNPHIIRMLVGVAKQLGEPTPVAAGGTAGKPRTGAQAMYPDLPSGGR